jgi:hypothetical protein
MNRLFARRPAGVFCALGMLFFLQGANAGEPWIAPGNVQVRHDIQLLVDSGVMDMPMSGWPIATSDLARALDHMAASTTTAGSANPSNSPGALSASASTTGKDGIGKSDVGPPLTQAQAAAIARLRRLASEGDPTLGFEIDAAGRPTILRTFADTPREEGEVSVYGAGFFGSRYGARLQITAVVDPEEDKSVRLDDSYVAGKFGNWIVTLGQQTRWWGSGWEGSLILSNNARPVPTIALDRAVSEPFESKWLSWIGPWRLTTFMGRMEGDRGDFDHPLLWGMRISARPLEGLEISVDRTAQWCGEGRSCTWNDFWNLFTGHDNAGENVAAEDEPGNQLASWDIRWAKPIGTWNYALYNQHTGETIDNKIPRPYRSLDVYGLETWGDWHTGGSSWRAGLEYANTRCGGTENGQKLWDCAYNNNIFTDGYRYYGRVIGHSMDGDGEMYSARFVQVDAASNTFTAIVRYSKVNEGGGVPDPLHSVAAGPEDWISLDFTYRRMFAAGWVEAGVGGDQQDRTWKNTERTSGRAYITWNRPVR